MSLDGSIGFYTHTGTFNKHTVNSCYINIKLKYIKFLYNHIHKQKNAVFKESIFCHQNLSSPSLSWHTVWETLYQDDHLTLTVSQKLASKHKSPFEVSSLLTCLRAEASGVVLSWEVQTWLDSLQDVKFYITHSTAKCFDSRTAHLKHYKKHYAAFSPKFNQSIHGCILSTWIIVLFN